MSNDTRPSLPPFPSSTVLPACFSMLHLCLRPMALATWDQLRSRGSINCPMQDKVGGRRYPWVRPVTATHLIRRCRPLQAMAFSSARTGSSRMAC